jgi:hypothetical protein
MAAIQSPAKVIKLWKRVQERFGAAEGKKLAGKEAEVNKQQEKVVNGLVKLREVAKDSVKLPSQVKTFESTRSVLLRSMRKYCLQVKSAKLEVKDLSKLRKSAKQLTVVVEEMSPLLITNDESDEDLSVLLAVDTTKLDKAMEDPNFGTENDDEIDVEALSKPKPNQTTETGPKDEPQPSLLREQFDQKWKAIAPAFNMAVVTRQGPALQQMHDLAFQRVDTDPGKAILVLARLEVAVKTALKEAVNAKTETPPSKPPITTPPETVQKTEVPESPPTKVPESPPTTVDEKTEEKPTVGEQPVEVEKQTSPTKEEMVNQLLKCLPEEQKEIAQQVGDTWGRWLEVNPALRTLKGMPEFTYAEGGAHAEGEKIVIPLKGKEPTDALAAYIFESGNVENQKQFDELKMKFGDLVKTKPQSLQDYGDKKLAVEANTIMDEFRAFAGLRAGKEALPKQADRNLADLTMAIAGSLKLENLGPEEQKLFDKDVRRLIDLQKSGSKEFDEFKDDEKGLKKWLDERPQLLAMCLKSMNENEETRAAILARSRTTIHDINSVNDPTDPKRLTSRELYAFEMVSEQPGTVVNGMCKQMEIAPQRLDCMAFKNGLTAFKKDPELQPAVESLVMLTGMTMKARLGEGAPNSVDFTKGMEDVARARLAKVKKDAPVKFEQAIATHYGKLKDALIRTMEKQESLKGATGQFGNILGALLNKPASVDLVATQFEKLIEGEKDDVKKSLRITWSFLEGLLKAL